MFHHKTMYYLREFLWNKGFYSRTPLAAFYISGIDNALVEINCEEVPIMDGSAKNF